MAVIFTRPLVLRGLVGFAGLASVVRLGTDVAANPAADPKPCAMPEPNMSPAWYASRTPPAGQA